MNLTLNHPPSSIPLSPYKKALCFCYIQWLSISSVNLWRNIYISLKHIINQVLSTILNLSWGLAGMFLTGPLVWHSALLSHWRLKIHWSHVPSIGSCCLQCVESKWSGSLPTQLWCERDSTADLWSSPSTHYCVYCRGLGDLGSPPPKEWQSF